MWLLEIELRTSGKIARALNLVWYFLHLIFFLIFLPLVFVIFGFETGIAIEHSIRHSEKFKFFFYKIFTLPHYLLFIYFLDDRGTNIWRCRILSHLFWGLCFDYQPLRFNNVPLHTKNCVLDIWWLHKATSPASMV